MRRSFGVITFRFNRSKSQNMLRYNDKFRLDKSNTPIITNVSNSCMHVNTENRSSENHLALASFIYSSPALRVIFKESVITSLIKIL